MKTNNNFDKKITRIYQIFYLKIFNENVINIYKKVIKQLVKIQIIGNEDFDYSKIKNSKLDRLRFGTAGIPIRAHGSKTHEGIAEVRKMGLEAMELEFVHSVNLNPSTAALANKARIENDVVMTAHGSYYINLNAILLISILNYYLKLIKSFFG